MYFKKLLLALVIISVLVFQNCEKSRDWPLQVDENTRLVVEGILTNEDTIQQIQISQTFTELNGATPFLSDADVSVEANGIVYQFEADTSLAGNYKSKVPFSVVNNLSYNLLVEWDGGMYEASSQLAAVAPISPIQFARYQQTDSLRLQDNIPPYNPNQQSMIEIDIDWSHLSPELPNKAKLYYYTFKNLHTSELIRPQKEVVPFPKGSILHIKKYGLNDAFADYLRAKAIETEWNGTYFYSTSENLPSNISNNGLGFFSTCSIIRQTIIAE